VRADDLPKLTTDLADLRPEREYAAEREERNINDGAGHRLHHFKSAAMSASWLWWDASSSVARSAFSGFAPASISASRNAPSCKAISPP